MNGTNKPKAFLALRSQGEKKATVIKATLGFKKLVKHIHQGFY